MEEAKTEIKTVNWHTKAGVVQREQRQYSWYGRTHDFGRAAFTIICPFCGSHAKAYIWSLCGGGKKCDCGAMHSGFGYSLAPIPKKPKRQKKS